MHERSQKLFGRSGREAQAPQRAAQDEPSPALDATRRGFGLLSRDEQIAFLQSVDPRLIEIVAARRNAIAAAAAVVSGAHGQPEAAAGAGVGEDDEHADKRSDRRRRARLASHIVFDNNMSTRKCDIVDLSKSGCRLRLPLTHDIPETFKLYDTNFQNAKVCRRVWRNSSEIGVEFLD